MSGGTEHRPPLMDWNIIQIATEILWVQFTISNDKLKSATSTMAKYIVIAWGYLPNVVVLGYPKWLQSTLASVSVHSSPPYTGLHWRPGFVYVHISR